MLGVGYLRTPFGKTSDADTRNFITVVLDSDSFAGPVGYFLPEFWKRRPRGLETATADFEDFGNVPSLNVTGGAFEIKSVPYLNMSDNTGLRLPAMAMPTRNGRTVLFMNQRGYEDKEVSAPLETAMRSGRMLDPATVCAQGTPTAATDLSACAVGNSSA